MSFLIELSEALKNVCHAYHELVSGIILNVSLVVIIAAIVLFFAGAIIFALNTLFEWLYGPQLPNEFSPCDEYEQSQEDDCE